MQAPIWTAIPPISSPMISHSPLCRPARTSSLCDCIPCGTAQAQRTARAGPSKAAKNPSPVVLISRPRNRASSRMRCRQPPAWGASASSSSTTQISTTDRGRSPACAMAEVALVSAHPPFGIGGAFDIDACEVELRRAVSAATRGSSYDPAPGRLACSFEQIVWRPLNRGILFRPTTIAILPGSGKGTEKLIRSGGTLMRSRGGGELEKGAFDAGENAVKGDRNAQTMVCAWQRAAQSYVRRRGRGNLVSCCTEALSGDEMRRPIGRAWLQFKMRRSAPSTISCKSLL